MLLGTATVAAAAAGLHPSLAEAGRAMVRSGRTVEPDPALRRFFDRRYAVFLELQQQEARLRGLLHQPCSRRPPTAPRR